MSTTDLPTQVSHIQQSLSSHDHTTALRQLTAAKQTLLTHNALLPSPSTPPHLLAPARSILEQGALLSIRLRDYPAFTRYHSQLQPFYDLPSSVLSPDGSEQSKITGLHLLLLLSQGDYAEFHTVLERLEVSAAAAGDGASAKGGKAVEGDAYIRYPVNLEEWLMEGKYDKVWEATKSKSVPTEEYGVFSEVLIHTIRSEIASCSERAYPSLPITSAKSLLFLDSEGAVSQFASSRGWTLNDGRIYFPSDATTGAAAAASGGASGDVGGADVGGGAATVGSAVASGQVIENAIGYARELETIV
ncbi:MAG: regulatory particle non-ATPase [Piccolia ochrophora]|nr:MAG: regulatory particle non-ATPase [Piccolia ochrophora]